MYKNVIVFNNPKEKVNKTKGSDWLKHVYLPIAVVIMASPFTCPAKSWVTELLIRRDEPAKQQLVAILNGI